MTYPMSMLSKAYAFGKLEDDYQPRRLPENVLERLIFGIGFGLAFKQVNEDCLQIYRALLNVKFQEALKDGWETAIQHPCFYMGEKKDFPDK